MGDPSDFSLGRGTRPIPKVVWESLDNMAAIVERLLTHYGVDMNRTDLAARQKELAQAHRILDKYRRNTHE
jgi:hypothetical protein